MRTEVVMKRELFGEEISQKSKSEYFSATDLVRAGNRWRSVNGMPVFNMTRWLNYESTKLFMDEIEKKYEKKAVQKTGSRGTSQTWVHPLLFIDMALAISPKLKIEVYEWLFDNLIKARNYSGDSYKKMCGALFSRHTNTKTFPDYIKDVASKIKKRCGVKDWERATEYQLEMRDRIHENISMLSNGMKDNDQIVRVALENTTVRL